MTMAFAFQFDSSRADAVIADLRGVETEVPRAISDAANATAKMATTFTRRQLAAAGGLPYGEFGNDGSVSGGSVRAKLGTPEEPAAAIRILNFNISQTHFKDKSLSRNMPGALTKFDLIEAVPNFPFRVPFPTRKWPIFTRDGTTPRLMTKGYYGPGGKWSQIHPGAALPMREPLGMVFGQSPRKIFETTPGIAESVSEFAQDKFDARLDKNLDKILKTGSARGGA